MVYHMIILGIDPGIAIVGYGVVEYHGNRFKPIDYGAITTPAGMVLERRLRLIYQDMNRLLERYQPDAVAVEELFFNTNVTTAIAVAHGRGVILLSANLKEIPTYEYTPLQVKQATTGYGRADKQQVQQMVKIMLKLNAVPKPDDVADALAIAICHGNSVNFNRLTQR